MRKILALLGFSFLFITASSQDNYEMQVYASPTMNRGETIFELHSNFTFNGEKNIVDGIRGSSHAFHETLEITHGITENFEIGFYLFTNYTDPYGYKVIGTHIRPRIAVPKKWNWPMGVSLSTEFGFQSSKYSSETWNIEVRPIIDKQFKKIYIAFNPTFSIGLKSVGTNHAPNFEPNLKTSYILNKVAVGFEYYGDLGHINQIPKVSQQSHALFVVADLNLNPKWEINIGPGLGLTKSTDRFVLKLLVGRRINWKHS